MQKLSISEMALRLELFVYDLPVSLDFYSRILGFKAGQQQVDGYTLVTNGEVHLGLNLRSNLPNDHPVQAIGNERLGRGIEIVLEVDDIDQYYDRVIAQNWPLSDKLQLQPWGLRDFRIIDPNGYYFRITSRSNSRNS
jgi:catechol 2,3-dioxygenase-like lactoylglutathione lyase family enzyme